MQITLPLVSIIVINYNYGNFIEEALCSVKSQSYSNIEVIVVDDRSTDDSLAIISRLTSTDGAFSNVRLYQTPVNGGQTFASCYGFRHSRGQYIVFLDADDVLMRNCIETHIFAHLSSRVPVGFSSVDCVNIINGGIAPPSSTGFSDYVNSGIGRLPKLFRPINENGSGLWEGGAPVSSDRLHFIKPPFCDPWCWSPTSGACYKRAAAALMLEDSVFEDLRTQTDSYMMRTISAISGSMLIDEPLMGYRLHGKNLFSNDVGALYNFRSYDAEAHKDMMILSVKYGMRRLFERVHSLGRSLADEYVFYDGLKALSNCWPGIGPEKDGPTYLYECLTYYDHQIRAVFPESTVNEWLLDAKVPNVSKDVDHTDKHTDKPKSWFKSILRRGASL